jgi:hypothetical protein
MASRSPATCPLPPSAPVGSDRARMTHVQGGRDGSASRATATPDVAPRPQQLAMQGPQSSLHHAHRRLLVLPPADASPTQAQLKPLPGLGPSRRRTTRPTSIRYPAKDPTTATRSGSVLSTRSSSPGMVRATVIYRRAGCQNNDLQLFVSLFP